MIQTIVRIFCATAIAGTPLAASDSRYFVSQWEISQKAAVKIYFADAPFFSFFPGKTKDYENRMFSQLMQINPELAGHAAAVKSGLNPSRELLFIDDKLVLITDEHQNADDSSFKKIFISLKDVYGAPLQTRENLTTFYTYKNDNTTAILQTAGSGPYNIKVFLYGKSLFRSMFFRN